MFGKSAHNCSVADFANHLSNGLIGTGEVGCGDHTTDTNILKAARKAGYNDADAQTIADQVRGVINEVR
jgi:hypothetical protein